MFPPQKKPNGKPAPKPGGGPSLRGGPPEMPGGGDPTAGSPFGPSPGSPQPGMNPGHVKPGQGLDPFTAMTQGLGPDILGAAGGSPAGGGPLAPMGPNGLPVGGSMPHGLDGGQDMGGSDLLTALAGAIGGDPYAANGQPPNLNVGAQDPNMGMEQLYQMLALAQLGVGGQPGAGGSGVPHDHGDLMGQMIGF
jgi:hypothetical protein